VDARGTLWLAEFFIMDDAQCAISRRDNRALAVQLIYAYEVSRESSFELLWGDLVGMLEIPEAHYNFAKLLARGVLEHLHEVDGKLSGMLIHWNFNRLAKVDLAILRLAIYEMLYCENIPHVVTINEAIELGKQYSSDDSKRIINGILDRLRKDICATAPPDI
jgi:N utilization substance protein B